MTSWRTIAKRTLGVVGMPLRPIRSPSRRWVLTFHEVGDHRWACPPSSFSAILEHVAAHASFVGLEELVEGEDGGPIRVAVTFDDGYQGVALAALPTLERLGIAATVFLPTDLLVEDDALPAQDRGLYEGVPLLGWRTIRRLAGGPTLRFESHGAAHRDLRTLSEGGRREELRRSRHAIEQATGRASRLLAYPFGAAEATVATAARDVGFSAAFTTRHGGIRTGDDRFVLPRVDVRADYTPSDVLAILRGDWDFLAWAQAARGRAR